MDEEPAFATSKDAQSCSSKASRFAQACLKTPSKDWYCVGARKCAVGGVVVAGRSTCPHKIKQTNQSVANTQLQAKHVHSLGHGK
jgi:hypothetical protein